MQPLEAFGEFPPVLYRVSAEKWARELVEHGRLRLSRVEYFVDIEDGVRIDETEGTGHQLVPGDVHKVLIRGDGSISGIHTEPGQINLHLESLTPTYIFCLSYPPDGDIAKLPWKFGSAAVRINDPKLFAQEITNWLTQEGMLKGLPVVECKQVRYDKGEPSEDLANHIERARLSFAQKPRRYYEEYEYRFAVLADLIAARDGEIRLHHEIDLGGPLEYAELLAKPDSI